MMNANEIYRLTADAIAELCAENKPQFNPVRLLVVGCSSSEIAGGSIGHDSTYEYGEARGAGGARSRPKSWASRPRFSAASI